MIFVRWAANGFSTDGAEISRNSPTLKVSTSDLRTAFQSAPLVDLSETMWGSLENSGSFSTTDLTRVRRATHDPQEFLVDRFIESLFKGRGVPAPLVGVIFGTPYLVSGESRLSVCRALGVKPRVQLADLSGYRKK